MRVDAVSYSKSKFIGFVRLYTATERESLKVKNIGGDAPVKVGPSYKRLIKFEYTAKVGTTLRAGAGGGYSALKTIPKGGHVTYMGRVGSWLRVYYGGKSGYVQATAFAKRDYLRGEDVGAVQQALQAAGFDPGEIDGVYGQQTAAAVVAYQVAKGLKVDGVVGPVTWAALIG
jgi:uncharacterized protein YgiM (DUF1202 family)